MTLLGRALLSAGHARRLRDVDKAGDHASPPLP